MAQGSSNGNITAITATIEIGETSTLDAGELATVENVGNEKHAILNFGIPKGDTGAQGERGIQGEQGVKGETGERGLKGDTALVINDILSISPLITSFNTATTSFNRTPIINETFTFYTHYTINSQEKSFLCIGKVNAIATNVNCSITNYIDITGVAGANGRDGADLEIDDATPSTTKVYSSNKVNAIKQALEQAIAQIVIPTAVSDLDNDLVFQTETQVANAINVLAETIASYDYASKSFVNSTINSLTAFFRGSFATKALLLAYTGEKTNNDYAYVEQDESHNNEAWRYIYVIPSGQTTGSWQAQFKVNDTPFTQAQLNALNSGITSSLISAIQQDIANNTSAINGKQSAITTTNKLSFSLIKDLPTLLKGASVNNNTLTLTFIDNTTVAFTPTFTETHVGDVVALTFGTGLSNGGTATNPKVQIASGYKLPTTTEWNNKANTSAIPTDNTQLGNGMGYLTAITSAMITTALGFTPYSASNPNGYTSNAGTITEIKMNGASKGTNGVVDLGTVLTAHQDISGKANISDLGAAAFSNKASDLNNDRFVQWYGTMSLTEAQKQNARSNIGAGTSDFSGDYNDLTHKPTILHLYKHYLRIFNNTEKKDIRLSLYTTSDTEFTFSTLCTYMYNNGSTRYNEATGSYTVGTDVFAIMSIQGRSSGLTFHYGTSGSYTATTITSTTTFTDKVEQIF